MTIWFDIDNSPHVLLFAPIIKILKKEGYKVIVTSSGFGSNFAFIRKT